MSRQSEIDLVVVVNGFPRLSETFVLEELLDLERRGVHLHVAALRRPSEAVQQEGLCALRADVTYLPDPTLGDGRRAVREAQASLRAARGRYADALARVLASPDFAAPDFSWSSLDRALILADVVRRLGSPPLYVHFAHLPGTIGRFAALLSDVPYGLSAHAKDIWLTAPRELARKVQDAEVVLTCTQEGQAYLAELAADETPVRLARHGVDLDLPRRRESESLCQGPVVVSVARLVEKKGFPTLLRAVAILRDRGVGCSLRIGGEGPQWGSLQRLVHTLEIADRVTFLGPLTPDEVAVELAHADIFALACERLADGDRDGIPNVILEAMANSLPIVSTTLAAVQEAVVHGQTGLLAPQGDAEAVAGRLERLLGDPGLRRQLGGSARRRAEDQFDRRATLPAVARALVSAGLLTSAAAAAPARTTQQPLQLAS